MKNELRKTGKLDPIGIVDLPRSAMTQALQKQGIPSNTDPLDVAPIKRQLPGLDISLAKANRKHHPGTHS